MGRFGAHMSIAGGLHNAFDEGRRVGCDCMQVFVKNQRQWHAPPLRADEIREWWSAAARTGIVPVVAHDTYLINLASPDEGLRKKSIAAFVLELTRCEQLGIPFLVAHPGSHMGEGEAAGLRRVAKSLDEAHKATRGFCVRTLLETTAGQGTSLGHRFEHLGAILAKVRKPERLGICFDTCHVFAAGYRMADPGDYAATMAKLDRAVGLDQVKCFHVNDSLRECGSRVDRHAHIGQGCVGRGAFRNLVTDPRFPGVRMILETPKGEDDRGRDWDRVNLAKLRRMERGGSNEL